MLHMSRSRTSRGKRKPANDFGLKLRDCERDELIRDFLEGLGTPRALAVWMLYRHGEHRQLVQLTIDPSHYVDHRLFRLDYAAIKFLSKCSGLKTGIDLEGVAIDSARRAETQCHETNLFVKAVAKGLATNLFDSEWFRAKQIIASILGPLPDFSGGGGWSPGRTTTCYGDELASIYKYASRPDVTWSAQLHALRELRSSPLWGASVLNADGPCSVLSLRTEVCEGNYMTTVPKSAKTDRVICYEPHMNIWLQLKVGTYLKGRLLRAGVNLRDQSVNQRRALISSRTGDYATIDLSMASDTVALELVYELLPIDWAIYLDELRSKKTHWPDGVWRENEKFSSMGNGFTFELESLIFYALASAVTPDVSVFGDDIICPTGKANEVIRVLTSAGFVVNSAKSFTHGPFRESCGMDGFCGVDVTPVYLRKLPSSRGDVAKLHNAIRAWCERGSPFIHWALMLRRWRASHPLPLGPSGYGDGHYHTNFDEARPKRASHGLDGWWYKSYIPVYRVSRMYGDRVSGRFSDKYGWSALCVSTGPKRPSTFDGLVQTTVDRRQVVYKQHRGLASFRWPDVVWF